MTDAHESMAGPPRPPVTAHGRTFSHEMREISGFGGGYEAACRAMVLAGVEWLSNHDGEAPHVQSYPNIIGVCSPVNEAAKMMEAAMANAPVTHDGATTRAGDDCTGAMMQFSIRHALIAHKLGWDAYVRKMSEPDDKETADDEPA